VKKIIVAVTGASGTVYARRFLQHLPYDDWEVHAIVSDAARLVAEQEGGLSLPSCVHEWDVHDLTAPMASGSNAFDAMVVIPCSTATMGKLAHGIADNLITRAGEVQLKERRKLILVPRETPLSLIQIKNMELLTLAGAVVLPANPSFYGNPSSVSDLVDTVVARVYDHAGIASEITKRWTANSHPTRSREDAKEG
jgi:4-hydroxy-3-polyprenylbenzoate decarboxylase